MNKKLVLITPDVIEECLCESLDILEKNIKTAKKIVILHSKTRESLK